MKTNTILNQILAIISKDKKIESKILNEFHTLDLLGKRAILLSIKNRISNPIIRNYLNNIFEKELTLTIQEFIINI